MIQSNKIQDIVDLASSEGNSVVEISEGWSKVKQVVHMRLPISKNVRDIAIAEGLRHWSAEPTPHNKGEEGFTDDVNLVSISFPR